jgi:hypothetical protein
MNGCQILSFCAGAQGERFGREWQAEGPRLECDVWLLVHNDIRHIPSIQATMMVLMSCFQSAQG